MRINLFYYPSSFIDYIRKIILSASCLSFLCIHKLLLHQVMQISLGMATLAEGAVYYFSILKDDYKKPDFFDTVKSYTGVCKCFLRVFDEIIVIGLCFLIDFIDIGLEKSFILVDIDCL